MKKITLCGSTRFKKEFEVINRQLSLEGHIVYSVSFFPQADNIPLSEEQKILLDKVHKQKIDNSDGIFVVDVDGYIGESTQSEIDYSVNTGKFVKKLSNFPDLKMLCDNAMIRHLKEQDQCEICEKMFDVEKLQLLNEEDTAMACPECYSQGVIATLEGFAELFPSQYARYMNLMEEGLLPDAIKKAFAANPAFDTAELIAELEKCFTEGRSECDGPHCMGCWKDVVRATIKKLQALDTQLPVQP